MHKHQQIDTQMCVIRLTIGAEKEKTIASEMAAPIDHRDPSTIPAEFLRLENLALLYPEAIGRRPDATDAASSPPVDHRSHPRPCRYLNLRRATPAEFISRSSLVQEDLLTLGRSSYRESRFFLFFFCSIFSRFFSSKRAEGLRPVHCTRDPIDDRELLRGGFEDSRWLRRNVGCTTFLTLDFRV